MWVIYILLVTVSVPVFAVLVLAIYASAIIARPLPERMHRATMLRDNGPTEPRANPRPPRSIRNALHRPQACLAGHVAANGAADASPQRPALRHPEREYAPGRPPAR
jgi:hypothetical protein